MPRRVRCCCCFSRRVCCCIIATPILCCWTTIAFIAYIIFFLILLPWRRAYYLETNYLHTLKRIENNDRVVQKWAKLSDKPSPARRRLQPLIQDVPQLHYWNIGGARNVIQEATGGTWTPLYNELIGLDRDGTGKESCKGKEYWVYLGGTSKDGANIKRAGNKDPQIYHHRYKKYSCTDPPYICEMYNSAFDRIAARWHGIDSTSTPPGWTSEAELRFIDCDISPLFCYSITFGLGMRAVMLLHVKIEEECSTSIKGVIRCPTTWRFLALPMLNMPWVRQIRIPLDGGGSTVVPAFPSAEEQMWSVMAHADAYQGIEYGNFSIMDRNLIARMDPSEPFASWMLHELGVARWGIARMVADALAAEDPPDAYVTFCELTFWLDILLRWWDGRPRVVRPVSCEIERRRVEAFNRESRKLREIAEDLDEKVGFLHWDKSDWESLDEKEKEYREKHGGEELRDVVAKGLRDLDLAALEPGV